MPEDFVKLPARCGRCKVAFVIEVPTAAMTASLALRAAECTNCRATSNNVFLLMGQSFSDEERKTLLQCVAIARDEFVVGQGLTDDKKSIQRLEQQELAASRLITALEASLG